MVPLFDRVLIKKAEAITKTKGGIVIPEKAQGKILQGTVVAVGPGQRKEVSVQIIPISIQIDFIFNTFSVSAGFVYFV